MDLTTLAAEGGYQVFELTGGEWFWLVFAALALALFAGALAWSKRGRLPEIAAEPMPPARVG